MFFKQINMRKIITMLKKISEGFDFITKSLLCCYFISLYAFSSEVFMSTGNFTYEGTGDRDYARVIYEKINAQGNQITFVDGNDELGIYHQIYTTFGHKILHVILNVPYTGVTFTQEGLSSFKTRGGKVVITVVEFAKYHQRHNVRELIEGTYNRLTQADSVIFLDEIDQLSARDTLNTPLYSLYKNPLTSVLDKSMVLYVPPTIPVITTPIGERGKNIMVFGMIRIGKGFAHVIRLAELLKEDSDPSLKGMKIMIVGTALDDPKSSDLYRIVHAMYPNRFNNRQESVPELKRRLWEIQTQEIEPVLPIDLHLDVCKERLPDLFRQCTYAYLPAYRGMTLRNSSVSSSLGNGFVLFSHIENITPKSFHPGGELYGGAVISLSDQYETYASWVLAEIKKRQYHPEMNVRTSQRALEITSTYLNLDKIAQAHVHIYENLGDQAERPETSLEYKEKADAAKKIQRHFRAKRAYAYTDRIIKKRLDKIGKSSIPLTLIDATIRDDREKELASVLRVFPWTLKHATSNLQAIQSSGRNCLRSVKDRQRKDPALASDHTSAALGLDDSVYFTIGGPDHQIASFLEGGATNVISVALKDLEPSQRRHLLFGPHNYEYATFSAYRVLFGTTQRLEQFYVNEPEKSSVLPIDGGYKTMTYSRADGSRKKRRVEWHEENALGDVILPFLIQYTIRELRLIGGDYQDYVLNNVSNLSVVEGFVNCLFHSHGFEARMPCLFDLSSPHVRVSLLGCEKTPLNSLDRKLVDAVDDKDLPTVRSLLERRANPSTKNHKGESVLLKAILENQADIALALLAAGANPISDKDNPTLYWSVQRGFWSVFRKLMETCSPLNSDGKICQYPDVQRTDLFMGTPLSEVLDKNPPEDVLRLLHQHGAHLRKSEAKKVFYSRPPILPILQELYPDSFKFELDRKELTCELTRYVGRINLLEPQRRLETAANLIRLGADVNGTYRRFPARSPRDECPIIFLVISDGFEWLKLLIDNGANLAVTNCFGQTVLDVVEEEIKLPQNRFSLNYKEMKDYLLKHNAPRGTQKLSKFSNFDSQVRVMVTAEDTSGRTFVVLGNSVDKGVSSSAYDLPIWNCDTNGFHPTDYQSMEEVVASWLYTSFHLNVPPQNFVTLFRHEIIDTPIAPNPRDKDVYYYTKNHRTLLLQGSLPKGDLPIISPNAFMTNLRWIDAAQASNLLR